MIKEATMKLVGRCDLSYEEASAVMNEIMSGEASGVQTAAFLAALETKGETIDEITACASVMRERAVSVETSGEVFEIVGTGGDGAMSFNISTTAAFVIAAGGVKVAKHGNRAASSASGAADCLEALGVDISADSETCAGLLDKIGICFLFAQKYHLSMKYVGPVRRELGIRTIFNILGPLTNPAHPTRQVLGVCEESLVEPLAHVLAGLGVRRGMVVYGTDRLDEISLCSPTVVCEFENGNFRRYLITPEDFGLSSCAKSELVGGTPQENAAITRAVLSGARGAYRDVVLLNAGAGLYIGGAADTLRDGVSLAGALIDSGAAVHKLDELIANAGV